MANLTDILRKYDTPGPRYTSYPTVPAWSEAIGAGDYETALMQVKDGESLSLYFHLPFCENLCHFCGCFKVITKDHSRSAAYVQAMLTEIDLIAQKIPGKKPVTQIHFGGGTPNFILPSEMAQLMGAIRKNFAVADDAEIAIEMHPRTSTKEFCETIAELGFNRISLGVQDFDERVQKLINRHQTFEMTRDMMTLLRSLGFQSFNFDLIYGLPGQSLEKYRQTLDLTLQLNPDRLAVYSYAHVPWKSPVQRTFADADLPSPELKLELFAAACEVFMRNGFEPIGIDHFAKKDDELFIAKDRGGLHRNFMGYSTRADAHQIGFGVSSISYVAGGYFQNNKSVDDYQKTCGNRELYTYRGHSLTRDDEIRRDLITEIMCHGRVEFLKFEKKYNINFADYFSEGLQNLQPFVADGLLSLDQQGFAVSGQGWLVLRNIAMAFDPYLDEIREKSKTPVFSRTV